MYKSIHILYPALYACVSVCPCYMTVRSNVRTQGNLLLMDGNMNSIWSGRPLSMQYSEYSTKLFQIVPAGGGTEFHFFRLCNSSSQSIALQSKLHLYQISVYRYEHFTTQGHQWEYFVLLTWDETSLFSPPNLQVTLLRQVVLWLSPASKCIR